MNQQRSYWASPNPKENCLKSTGKARSINFERGLFVITFYFLLSISSVDLPYTDEILPRTDLEIVSDFYQMLHDVDSILTDAHIPFWLIAGSLLGAVRHQGMIPWDDDIDLGFFLSDLQKLLSLQALFEVHGYSLHIREEYLKIYPTEGRLIINDQGKLFPYRYPFIDLFPMTERERKVSYAHPSLYKNFGANDWFDKEDLELPMSKASFGPHQFPIPRRSIEYCERVYGEDVWTAAYADYDHSREEWRKRIKVRLVTKKPLFERD